MNGCEQISTRETIRSLSNNSMQPFGFVGKQSCDGCDPFTLSPSVLHFKIFTAFYVNITFATGGYEQDLQRVKVLGSNFQTRVHRLLCSTHEYTWVSTFCLCLCDRVCKQQSSSERLSMTRTLLVIGTIMNRESVKRWNKYRDVQWHWCYSFDRKLPTVCDD